MYVFPYSHLQNSVMEIIISQIQTIDINDPFITVICKCKEIQTV